MKGWRVYTLLFVPAFAAKAQNPSKHVAIFEELLVPSVIYFMVGDRDVMTALPHQITRKVPEQD